MWGVWPAGVCDNQRHSLPAFAGSPGSRPSGVVADLGLAALSHAPQVPQNAVSIGPSGVALGKLVYSTIMSVDGYVADANGSFDWAKPNEKVHSFINDLQRSVGTYLFGRRMYEIMVAWEQLDTRDRPGFIRDYARIWRAAEKIVFSSKLETASSARTRIERRFDSEAVRSMKDTAARDLAVGGPHLAAHAFMAGLVDECQLFIAPIAVGGGTAAFPMGVIQRLSLESERRFDNGVVFLDFHVVT